MILLTEQVNYKICMLTLPQNSLIYLVKEHPGLLIYSKKVVNIMIAKSEKEILLLNSDKNLKSLLEIIESVPSRKRGISIETQDRDKNFRDVLMHLYEWHVMLERWYREGMDGDIPFMPAPGYKWGTIKLLNMQIWENYQDVTLNQAIKKIEVKP